MPRGKFGFRRLTSLGPLVESEDELLFHLTREDFVESILKHGFQRGYGQALASAEKSSNETFPIKRAVRENMMFDFLMDHYKPAEKDEVSERFGSTFFLPTLEKVEGKKDAFNQGDVYPEDRTSVIAVDPDKIPCSGSVGNYKNAERVNNILVQEDAFDSFEDFETFQKFVTEKEDTPSFVEKEILEYWDSTRIYEMYADDNEEVWFRCNIPSSAIESVTDLKKIE